MDTLTDAHALTQDEAPAKKFRRFTFVTATRTWRFYTEEPVFPDVALTMFCEKTGLSASAIMMHYAEDKLFSE